MSDEEHPLADAALAVLEGRAAPPRRLFVALDGARDPRVVAEVRAAGAPAQCLFHGVPPEVEAASPWLVDLTDQDALTAFVLEWGLGRAWGVFLLAPVDLAALAKHLRTLLRVKREDGTKLLFRWYDPRVLRVYLPTCTPDELGAFFGPVEEAWLDAREPDALVGFGRSAQGELAAWSAELAQAPAARAIALAEVL